MAHMVEPQRARAEVIGSESPTKSANPLLNFNPTYKTQTTGHRTEGRGGRGGKEGEGGKGGKAECRTLPSPPFKSPSSKVCLGPYKIFFLWLEGKSGKICSNLPKPQTPNPKTSLVPRLLKNRPRMALAYCQILRETSGRDSAVSPRNSDSSLCLAWCLGFIGFSVWKRLQIAQHRCRMYNLGPKVGLACLL